MHKWKVIIPLTAAKVEVWIIGLSITSKNTIPVLMQVPVYQYSTLFNTHNVDGVAHSIAILSNISVASQHAKLPNRLRSTSLRQTEGVVAAAAGV